MIKEQITARLDLLAADNITVIAGAVSQCEEVAGGTGTEPVCVDSHAYGALLSRLWVVSKRT